MKRIICCFLALILTLGMTAGAAGYSLDPDSINQSAASVMLLAVYDMPNRLIATGSGFVAFDENYAVTNYHVIEGSDVIIAYTDAGEEKQISRVLCADSGRDIAILVFDEESGLAPLEINAEAELTRGAPVVAIGSPIGFRNTVSIGNISASEGEEADISFTAPISSGSSGGALIDDDGYVIGVTSSAIGGAQNMNFAVNAAYVKELFEAHSSDEPVPLAELESVNYETEVKAVLPAARDFTIKNYAGFSISEVYLYPDGAKNWGKARNTSGWLYNNSSMTFTVTDEEAEQNTRWTLNFCFRLSGCAYYIDYTGINLSSLLGRSLLITMENGNTIYLEIE